MPEFISSHEYFCIIRLHKYSNEGAADGHLPAAFSWLSVLPLEFCTAQSHNPLITFYLREREKQRDQGEIHIERKQDGEMTKEKEREKRTNKYTDEYQW